MKKRILSIVLVLSMLMAFMPIITSAETSGTCGDNLTWTLDDSGTLTISGTGDMTDYALGSSLAPWYNSRNSIKAVIIDSGVTSIGKYAFSSCSSLTSIAIPDSVTSINDNALSSCSSLTSINVDSGNQNYCSVDGILFSKDKKMLIQYPAGKTDINYTIPDSVTNIGRAAFSVCRNLTSIAIPDSVISIGTNAFSMCRSLTSITIPDSVTTIDDYAFYGCSSLTSITIPDSVTNIGRNAFYVCNSLTSINVDSGNQNYCSVDGILFSKDKKMLIQYPAGKTDINYIIPEGVTSIGDCAFSDCRSLTSITIPDSVTSIAMLTFANCSSLTSITIPEDVTSIGVSAFAYCTDLTDVYYSGTETQWNAISIGSRNDALTNAVIHCSGITSTSTPTPEPSATPTATPMPTATPTATPSASPSPSPSASPTATPTATPSASPSPSPSATPTASPSASPTATPTVEPTASPSPSASPTATPTLEPTASPTATPTPTLTPSPTPTATPSASPSPSPSASPTATPTASPTTKPKRKSGSSSGITLTPKPTAIPKSTAAPSAEPTNAPKETVKPTTEVKQHKAYITGYEGKFTPNGNITRAETAAMLARLTDSFNKDESYTVTFPDITDNVWYKNYIGFEENQNIITGYRDGTLKPVESITRAEFVSMITRFANLSTANADTPFTDTDGHWAAEQIAACYAAGYIKGYLDNTFQPDNYITRAEAVVIINRVTGRNDIKDFENPFTDVTESHWAYADIMKAAVTHDVN